MTTNADPARATTHCRRCGRLLRSLKAVALGLGPTCAAKVAAAAKTSTEKPAQVAKAQELIELGAIVPLPRRRSGTRVFRVVSSRGDATYLTATNVCSCPAGLKSRACYHELAVQFLIQAA